jgi:Cache domain
LFGTEATRGFLHDRLKVLPQANAFSLFTADGRLFLTTRTQPAPVVDVFDRDFFRHFLEHDDPAPFVSAPLQSRLTGTPTIYIARRINGPGGNFLGLVVGAIDLPYLAAFYRAIQLPQGEVVTLLRRDGRVLVRYPDTASDTTGTMPARSPWYRLVAMGGGTYRSPGLLGPVPAIVAVRPLPAWPLVIDVAMHEPVALAKWRMEATVIGLAGVGAAAGFAAMFGLIGRQFRRQTEQNARLAASATALRASEARIRDFAEMSTDWLWELDAELRLSWVSDSGA